MLIYTKLESYIQTTRLVMKRARDINVWTDRLYCSARPLYLVAYFQRRCCKGNTHRVYLDLHRRGRATLEVLAPFALPPSRRGRRTLCRCRTNFQALLPHSDRRRWRHAILCKTYKFMHICRCLCICKSVCLCVCLILSCICVLLYIYKLWTLL